jgi:hypothetical protein
MLAHAFALDDPPARRRTRTRAPDAEAALRRLREVRSRLLGFYALLTLENPAVLGQVLLAPIEAGAPRLGDGPEAPLEHWVHAARQMALTREQVGGACKAWRHNQGGHVIQDTRLDPGGPRGRCLMFFSEINVHKKRIVQAAAARGPTIPACGFPATSTRRRNAARPPAHPPTRPPAHPPGGDGAAAA